MICITFRKNLFAIHLPFAYHVSEEVPEIGWSLPKPFGCLVRISWSDALPTLSLPSTRDENTDEQEITFFVVFKPLKLLDALLLHHNLALTS